MLTWVMAPEAICMIASHYADGPTLEEEFGIDLVSEYFRKQRHSDLVSFTDALVKDKSNWCDKNTGT